MTLNVEKLSKRYGNTWALRDVSFAAADGEVFGIFGGTASGKTSLLRCIAGQEPANGGTISAGGQDVSAVPAKQRGIYLAEPRKPGGITSIFGGKSEPISDGETRIRELESGLESAERVMLFDEPFVGVDTEHRERLAARIRELGRDGRTVIVASSDFGQIASVCDRTAVLVKGYLEQIGTPQEVYENPENTAVASVVGRFNLFEARRLTSTDAELPEFQTIVGGHRLFAQQTEKNRLGAINQSVRLAVRPEQVSISFGASFPEDNVLKAIVTGIRFLGPTTIIELDAGGLKLEARVFRVVGLDVGEECMIGIPPVCLHVLRN